MAGCLVSLSMLSTRLTLLLMVATPALMGVGTLMGSALRKLSRQCQEQVSEFPPAPPRTAPPQPLPSFPRLWKHQRSNCLRAKTFPSLKAAEVTDQILASAFQAERQALF